MYDNFFIKQMAHHTIKAMENDRKALSKEIHDSIGGSLAAIKMLLEAMLLNPDGTTPDNLRSLEKIVGHLSDTIKESKRISYQMRSMALDDLDLVAAISEIIRNFNEFFPQIQVDFQFHTYREEISDDIKMVVYRVVQEALNNVGKHSHAKLVTITLSECKKRILLKVEDNGCGFDVSKNLDTEKPLQGYGMRSMNERVEICKGSFAVISKPGKGTVLLAYLPKSIS